MKRRFHISLRALLRLLLYTTVLMQRVVCYDPQVECVRRVGSMTSESSSLFSACLTLLQLAICICLTSSLQLPRTWAQLHDICLSQGCLPPIGLESRMTWMWGDTVWSWGGF